MDHKQTVKDLYESFKNAVEMYKWFQCESSYYTLERIELIYNELNSFQLTNKQRSRIKSLYKTAKAYIPINRFYEIEPEEYEYSNSFDNDADGDEYWFLLKE